MINKNSFIYRTTLKERFTTITSKLLDVDSDEMVYTTTGLNLSFLAIGFIGNGLCIYAFSKKRMRSVKLNLYSLAIAVFQFIFCLFLFGDYIYRLFSSEKVFLHQFNKILNILFDCSIHTIDSYLAVLRLILSIDRLYAIKKPLNIKTFATNLHANRFIILTFLLLILLKIPGTILCHIYETELVYISYYSMISPFIFNILPTISVLTINLILIKALVKNFRKDSKENTEKTRISEIHVTLKNSVSIRKFCKRQKSSNKTHYISIIILSLWQVLSTVPYYTFNSYNFIVLSNFFEVEKEVTLNRMEKLDTIQAFLAFFFNISPCFNIFVYIFFNNNFRNCFYKKCKIIKRIPTINNKKKSV
jgi:hypothetical protein